MAVPTPRTDNINTASTAKVADNTMRLLTTHLLSSVSLVTLKVPREEHVR